ncbi:MAG TPA: hypothetical protein PKK83_23800 [Polyangiaceae bacterium]|nr:hypothetical protein [Polyangiaceae bacterium]HOR36761.1 hypothetical protein [Polyangiaceae bacterium]
MKRSILTGSLLLAMVASASLAEGQLTDAQRKAARTAANEGLQAFESGDFPHAIEQFEQANQIIRAPTHTLYIARAYAKLGQWLKARELYSEIVQEPLAAEAPPAFVQARKDAENELETLEALIPRITIEISGHADETVQVTMNDKPIAAEAIGVAQRVEPGTYLFRATSGQFRARSVKITIAEKERKTVNLELEAEPPPSPSPTEPVAPVSTSANQTTVYPYLGYGALGIGVAGIALGFYFNKQHADRLEEGDSLFDKCNPRVCTVEERNRISDIDDEASSNKQMSTISFVAGGVAIVGGAALLLFAPSQSGSSDTSSSVRPWLGLNSAGISGSF